MNHYKTKNLIFKNFKFWLLFQNGINIFESQKLRRTYQIKSMVKLKRTYEVPVSEDGTRILVERLWPRGLTREKAKIDIWLKEIAPSTELRKWYNHIPERWPEFQKRYRAELSKKRDLTKELKRQVDATNVTFVFAARDENRNSAVVLRSFLEEEKNL